MLKVTNLFIEEDRGYLDITFNDRWNVMVYPGTRDPVGSFSGLNRAEVLTKGDEYKEYISIIQQLAAAQDVSEAKKKLAASCNPNGEWVWSKAGELVESKEDWAKRVTWQMWDRLNNGDNND